MYIRGMYTAIAVTRNMHQIAARKYCCIGSLLASRKFGNCADYIPLLSGNFKIKQGSAFDHNSASCLGYTDQGSALNLGV